MGAMKGAIAVLAALCALAPARADDLMPKMVKALRKELDHISQEMPSGVVCGAQAGKYSSCLVEGPATSGAFRTGRTEVSGLHQLEDQWKLPKDVRAKVHELVIAKSVTFEAFHVSVKAPSGSGSLTEYIGAARRQGDTADVVAANVAASATLHPQYDAVSVKKCHHCWLLFHCCHHVTEHRKRGFTGAEIKKIEDAMRSAAWTRLTHLVNEHASLSSDEVSRRTLADPEPAHLPSPPGLTTETPGALIKDAVKKVVDEFPQLKKLINQPVKDEKVEEIVGRGFDVFKQSVDIQKLDGVAYKNLKELFSMLKSQLNLPSSYESEINDALSTIKYEESTTWIVFKLAFSENKGGSCRDVVILAHNNPDKKTTDWIVGNVAATFDLAPDLVVIRSSKSYLGGLFKYSTDHIKKIPRSLDQQSLNTLFTFFDVVAFKRFAEVVGADVSDSTEATEALSAARQLLAPPTADVQLGGSFSGIMGAITGITKAWQGIVDAFSTKISEKIMKQIQGKGFSSVEESAQLQKIVGMEESFLDTFIAHALGMYNVPSEYHKQATYALQMVKYADEQDWMKWDMMFNTGKGGDVKYVCITGNREVGSDGKSKYNFLVANVGATFELAPNLIIIEKSASYAGGIFQKTKDIIKKVPRSVTQADVEGVLDFFLVCAVKRFADELGIKVTNPKMPSGGGGSGSGSSEELSVHTQGSTPQSETSFLGLGPVGVACAVGGAVAVALGAAFAVARVVRRKADSPRAAALLKSAESVAQP